MADTWSLLKPAWNTPWISNLRSITRSSTPLSESPSGILTRLGAAPVSPWWAATAVWAAQMFHFSTAGFSSEVSRSALLKILGWLGIRFADGTLGVLNSLFRSAAHIAEYCVLSLLLYRCFSGRRGFQWRQRTALWCAGVSAAFALTDELHQALVPNRGSSLLDCVIDGAGIAMGMLCIKGLNNRRESNHSRASGGTSVPDRRLEGD